MRRHCYCKGKGERFDVKDKNGFRDLVVVVDESIKRVIVDPGSKPDQKLCSAERHAKIREREFRLCTYTGTL